MVKQQSSCLMHFCCDLSFLAITRFLWGTFGQHLMGGGTQLAKFHPQLNERVIPFLLIFLKKGAGARPNSKGAEAYQGAKA